MATQTMAKDDQDFSFPATLESPPPPRFLELPPIWWRTSAASHRENPKKGEEEEGEDGSGENFCYFSSLSRETCSHTQRRSFSCIEGRTKRRDDDGDGDGDDGEQEKMDMLWEDFNEEYKRSRDLSAAGKKLEMKFVQSLKLSKPIRRPRMVVVLKVLKKVFLLHNSHNSIFKKHP